MIGQVERDAEEAAAGGLRAVADLLPAGAVRGVAVVVKGVSVPDRLPDVLRSHAWMHAAEGILYREAVLAAAQACGWTAHAVELASLPAAEHARGRGPGRRAPLAPDGEGCRPRGHRRADGDGRPSMNLPLGPAGGGP